MRPADRVTVFGDKTLSAQHVFPNPPKGLRTVSDQIGRPRRAGLTDFRTNLGSWTATGPLTIGGEAGNGFPGLAKFCPDGSDQSPARFGRIFFQPPWISPGLAGFFFRPLRGRGLAGYHFPAPQKPFFGRMSLV